jgi:hypothetical protein
MSLEVWSRRRTSEVSGDAGVKLQREIAAQAISPVKSPVKIPSYPYLGVLRRSRTASKLLGVVDHSSVSR